jgi:SAM-dependent methyltransferase
VYRNIVASGYDAIGRAYTDSRRLSAAETALIEDFAGRLPDRACVLDLGCGGGRPLTEWLARRFKVTGIDVSSGQIARAEQAVPSGTFICADMTSIDLPASTFHGICSLYAMIHIPRELQGTMLVKCLETLTPGGHALLCLGANDLADDYDEFMGARMFWSHFDSETNVCLMEAAGFELLRAERVKDAFDGADSAEHLFVLARRPIAQQP